MSWIDEAVAKVQSDPTQVRTLFATAGRKAQGSPIDARFQLLQALGSHLCEELSDLYRFGDTNERIAILQALPNIETDVDAMALVRDALRTNDVRLVTSALNDYSYTKLSQDELDHAIMKCVFMDVAIDSVAGLTERAAKSTAQMLADFVLERTVAGRYVQPAVWQVIDNFDIDLSAIEEAQRTKQEN